MFAIVKVENLFDCVALCGKVERFLLSQRKALEWGFFLGGNTSPNVFSKGCLNIGIIFEKRIFCALHDGIFIFMQLQY